MKSERTPAAGFLSGVLLSQVANAALHLAQPLLIAQLSGSLGRAALFSAFDTAVHMGGSLVGGWPADRVGARRLLIVATFLRAAALAVVPLLWLGGRLTLGAAMAAYTLDALVRGFVDTAVHALPLELGGGDRAELDRLNSRYELAFDLGGVAGPSLLAAAMLAGRPVLAQAAVPAGFALAAVAFLLVPSRPSSRAARAAAPAGGPWEGLRAIRADSALLAACAGAALLNLYPLRKLLSAFFAKGLLGSAPAAGWIGAAFGLGGAAGALLYGARAGRGGGARWVAAGALGTLALAAGWIPAALRPMLGAAFLFALANVGARLALTRRMQERTPPHAIGGVAAVSRFAANGVSVGLKALVGAAFALGAGPRAAFAVVGVGLAAVATAQLGLAAGLKKL